MYDLEHLILDKKGELDKLEKKVENPEEHFYNHRKLQMGCGKRGEHRPLEVHEKITETKQNKGCNKVVKWTLDEWLKTD